MRAKINKGSIDKKIKAAEAKLEEKTKGQLTDIAEFATESSPVLTGAFVTSWAISTAGGGGRSVSSIGKPRASDKAAKQGEGLRQLLSDIQSIKVLEQPQITLSNRAPHAGDVDNKYDLSRRIKDRYR